MPDGASQSRYSLAFAIETTRGTTPATPPYIYNRVRQGTTLQVDKTFEQSTEIISTRDPGVRIGGVAGWSGTLNSFLVRDAGLEEMLESALSGAYAAVSLSAITGTWAASGSTFTRAAGNFLTAAITAKLEPGDLVFGAGTTSNQTTLNGAIDSSQLTLTLTAATAFIGATFIKIDSEIMEVVAISTTAVVVTTRGACGTTAASHSNGATILPGHQITAVTATVLTFGTETVVNEASVSTTFTTSTRILVPGSTRKFGTFEQLFGDIALYEIFKGGEVNTAQFALPTSGEITLDFALLGTKYATGQVAGSTYTAASTRTPFAASTAGSSLTKDGVVLGTCVENLQFTVNNNRALKYGVGEQFACFVEEGTREIDMTFGVYLVDGAFQTLFQAETRFALKAVAVSADGDKFNFIWPRLVITSLPRAVSGQTFVENCAASAEKDSTTGTAFYVREIALS